MENISIEKQRQDIYNIKFNKLDDYDKNLILWIKENKPIIYVDFKAVSRSGMLRRVNCFMIKDNEIYWLNHLIEQMTHYKKDSDNLLKLFGCGMDMGFKVVSDFSSILFYDLKENDYKQLLNRNI